MVKDMKKFLSSIDFKLLREQKETLTYEVQTTDDTNLAEALMGITHLIDDIQDTAISYGYKESDVFNIEEPDESDETLMLGGESQDNQDLKETDETLMLGGD